MDRIILLNVDGWKACAVQAFERCGQIL